MHPRKAYVLFMALCGGGFGAAAVTYVPALLERGLSLADVAAVNVFFWLTISVMELPTGLLADGKSRAWSVRAGSAIFVIGEFGYATATTFAGAVLWECVLGLGFAFLSGAQQAWVTDALIRRDEGDKIRETFGTASASKNIVSVIAGSIGGFLGTIDLRAGWIVAGIFHLAAFFVAMRWIRGQGEPIKRMTEGQAFSASLAATRSTPGLRWSMMVAVAFGLVIPFNHYWTPFFRERIGQEGIAILWVPIVLCLGLGGLAVRRKGFLIRTDGAGTLISLSIAGAGLVIAGYAPGIVIPIAAVLVHEFGRGMFEPLMDSYVQRHVQSGYRATYASFQSLVSRAGYGLILLTVWAATRDMPSDGTTISIVWIVAGIVLLLVTYLAWRYRPRELRDDT